MPLGKPPNLEKIMSHLLIEKTTVLEETRPSYFVDLVENGSAGNLRCFDYRHEAFAFARELAVKLGGLRIEIKGLK